MRADQLREMTREELVQRRGDLIEEQFNLQMRKSYKALDNPLRLRVIRRDIARIETVLHEDDKGIRALAQAKSSILDDADKGKK